jgi:tRNA threonylcarbamoyladenosine biosynthesis protein TsaE
MSKTFTSKELSDLPEIARQIVNHISNPSIVLLNGKMGAGKTTLIKHLARSLGVGDLISSPTFSLVNEYTDQAGELVYHFDLYRLEVVDEAYDMGIEEYLDSGCWCFIEWPDLIKDLLPEKFWVVDLLEKEGKRLIELSSSS